MLLKLNSDPNCLDSHHASALTLATNFDTARALIQYRADVNHADAHARTALHMSSVQGQARSVIHLPNGNDPPLDQDEVVRLLLEKRADASLPDGEGVIALMRACQAATRWG